jgi:hypothetical protein
MRTKLLILTSLLLVCCLSIPEKKAYLDLNTNLRQLNYNGGSCVYASLCIVLDWQHRSDLSNRLRHNYSGAASQGDLIRACESLGINYAYTIKGDPEFLEWCDRTNRGAAIFYFNNHAVTFAGYITRDKQKYAWLIDNNAPSKYIEVPKNQFIAEWKKYGGFALTSVYSPSPPKPGA